MDELDEGDYVYGHHVVPNQCGNPADPAHSWLETELNCVALCRMCHTRVHQNGNPSTGAVAPPEYFPYSHKNASEHEAWVKQVSQKAQMVWRYVEQKYSYDENR